MTMSNHTLTVEICPECLEELQEAAAYFRYETVGAFVADMIATEFPRAKTQMLANKYREYEEAIERAAGVPLQNRPLS